MRACVSAAARPLTCSGTSGGGVRGAFRIGYGHGLYCLGCCWALMLLGFAAGVVSIPWMAILTLVIVFEKTGRGGDRK
jgi:predicted metal-binding membrane protein